MLAVLVVVFIVGHVWFHIVEGAFKGLKRLFSGKKAPAAWHPLPSGQEKEKKEHV